MKHNKLVKGDRVRMIEVRGLCSLEWFKVGEILTIYQNKNQQPDVVGNDIYCEPRFISSKDVVELVSHRTNKTQTEEVFVLSSDLARNRLNSSLHWTEEGAIDSIFGEYND